MQDQNDTSPQDDVWTIGRLLTWTTDYLKRNGAESPRLDAEVLLADVLGCKRIELYTAFEQEADETTRNAFRELVGRRAKGTPVAYLVGRREFYSLDFRVTPDVLIPRPETELLVVAILDAGNGLFDGRPRIADVGTGSGIIAVSAAKHLPEAQIAAIDISAAALEVARGNSADHGVEDRIEWIESDLFASVSPDRRFDIIASNPPYVSSAEMAALAPDVREHEPQGALEAGPRGTEIIESLVPQSAERLTAGGRLYIEISPTIHDAAREIIAADSRFEIGETIKDLARLPRVVQARRV